MTKLSFSQNSYPAKVVINNDTVCAISIAQIDSINLTYVHLQECNELVDTLESTILNYGKLDSTQKSIIHVQEEQIIELQNENNIKDIIIKNDDKIIETLTKDNKCLKLQRNILVGVAGILILTTLFL